MDSTNTPAATADPLATASPQPSAPLGLLLGDPLEAAQSFGWKHRLQASDGTWHCWGCGVEMPELVVTLHCDFCMEEYRRNRARRKHERRMEQLRSWQQVAGTFAAHADPEPNEIWDRG